MNQFGIKNSSLKWWQKLLCLCCWAWNCDPFASVSRWNQLGPEKAETQNKHFLETRMVMGNELTISSQWIQPWPYLFTAKHDVCMYNSQIIKYSKLLLYTDYGVTLCSAACTSFERQPLWRKMACCLYHFPSPEWILHCSQRHTLGLSLTLTKGLCLGAFASNTDFIYQNCAWDSVPCWYLTCKTCCFSAS